MSQAPIILIANKDPNGHSSFAEPLELEFNCIIEHVSSEEDLDASLEKSTVSILVLDLELSYNCENLSFLTSIKNSHPDTLILPIIPATKPQLAREVLDLDLFYFIHKPLDPLELRVALKRAYDTVSPKRLKSQQPAALEHPPFHNIIGASKPMLHLFDLIRRVAEDDMSTVLIRGESGTGKEMVAKAIHGESNRRNQNFVPVNCAAIPDDLLESELFGYTKGAFTGATANKPGRIQYADQGTLFLDEIGDMKSSLQAKLLRVIQEKEFEPVGAFKSIPVNTRILAATHCDLEKLVNEGKFREDLYYRLSVVPLHIPSLRERREDIPLLINSFLAKYGENRGRERFTFSPRALAAISHYGWRGNVRELENLIQHMVILFSGKEVDLAELPEKFHEVEIPPDILDTVVESNQVAASAPLHQDPASKKVNWENGQVDFNELINDFETQLIVQAMQLTEGNKKEAARLLNLKRTTLLEKIKKKNIEGLWKTGR